MRRWLGHLRLKVLAFGIAMSVIPLALLGWYGYEVVSQAQVQTAQAKNRAAARTVAEQLAQFVHHVSNQLELLARVQGGALVQAGGAEQERVLYTLLRDIDYLEEVALLAPDGQELRRASRREVTTGLPAASHAESPLWAAIRRDGRALGAVTLDVDGRPLFPLGVALPDGGGALVARATLRGIMANIVSVRGSGDVRIHVLDERRQLIAGSDFSLVLAGSHAPVVDEAGPYRSLTGEDALGVTVPVPDMPWQVMGETTLATAMAPRDRLAVAFAGGALLLMLVVVGLSVYFGLQLTGPLERLEAGARGVGAGDLTIRVTEGGRDELGRLITAFNAMTARLGEQSKALQAERDRLDTVVSAIGAGLALSDGDGRILWANRTLREWYPDGVPPGLGSDGPAERHALIQGRLRLLRYHTHPVAGGGPGGPARLEVIEDVTDRRAMEAMVAQSEKLAAVGQLAAGVAHEINNPLAVISAYAEDLSDRLREEGAPALEQSGELQRYLMQLHLQVQRCKGITGNLLDFARRGPAEPEAVDVLEVARQTADLVGPRARRVGVRVSVAPAGQGVAPVRASRDQMQQVLLNLVSNALDATEGQGSGGIAITAGLTGSMVTVTVTDDGPGMDESTQLRALEPFFTTKPPGRGTGLGLSTCYGIITGLGGSLSVASTPGEGTAVTFTLPVWTASEGGSSRA